MSTGFKIVLGIFAAFVLLVIAAATYVSLQEPEEEKRTSKPFVGYGEMVEKSKAELEEAKRRATDNPKSRAIKACEEAGRKAGVLPKDWSERMQAGRVYYTGPGDKATVNSGAENEAYFLCILDSSGKVTMVANDEKKVFAE
jgi:hypothetical protein